MDKFIAAVVQAAPVVFDPVRTIEKLSKLSADAARKGARLALFPEAFISAYPKGLDFGARIGMRSAEGECILTAELDMGDIARGKYDFDVVEAMASHRPYRAGLGIDKALAEIERGRGSAYDPVVADACLKLFRQKGYAIPA